MKTLGRIAIALIALVFLGSAGYLAYDYFTAQSEQSALEGLQNEVARHQQATPMPVQGGVIHLKDERASASGVSAVRFPEEPETILPQYQALYEENPDMIGWIRIENTKVNYPVMQTPLDPEFYLRANWQKEYAYSGLPFLDYRCDIKQQNQSLLIYGHNMKSGTMFGCLSDYGSQRFYENHKTIQFDTIHGARTYEVLYAFRSKYYSEGAEGFRYYEYLDLSREGVYNGFMRQAKAQSLITPSAVTVWGDQILMMSTCSYHTGDGTFVVVAKRVA